MSDVITKLKQGQIPELILNEVGPFSLEAHEQHVAFLESAAEYEVFGHRFYAVSGLYHPHPWSSSVFILRSLLRERPSLGCLLELGCGTGAVGLSLLSHGLADQLVLTDIDPAAVRVAWRNAEKSGVSNRTKVKQGSLFEPVQDEQFDSIIFNLPLMHQVHDGAKHLALDDALGRVAQQFFEQVKNHLKPGGRGFFSFSNISNPQLLESFAEEVDLSLVAAEWVVKSGFWLMLYTFDKTE